MSRNNVVGSEPYHKCTDAYTKGHSLEKVISYYNNWAQEGTYETVLCADHYSGPEIVAQFVEHYFSDRKDDTSIIDVAAGTGRVGEELKIRGFTKVDAIEPSKEMLSIAATKNIYGRIIHDCMDGHRTDIKDDTYDALTIAGGMGEGHIPTRAMTELIRIVKPGGYVCIVMREEFLSIVADYTDRLEPFMHQLAEQGAWTRKERRVIPKYSFGTNGVVFVYRVKESGAPTVTSTQFTK